MGRKNQRRSRAEHRHQHNSNSGSTEEIPSCLNVVQIKEDPDIKLEPQLIGELESVPVQSFNNPADSCEDDGIGCHYYEIDKLKIEVKDECEKKEKEANKPNAASDGELYDERNALSLNDNNANGLQLNDLGYYAQNLNQTRTRRTNRGRGFKQHQCPQCKYTAASKSNLEVHLRTHTGEKPFPCQLCAKRFAQELNLQNHLKVHVDEFPFNCAMCLKGFNQKHEKMDHETKCKTRRYECHLCKKSFGIKNSHLINHMRTHSGSKPFTCTECSKQFTTKTNLNRHIKLHAGPRRFRCSKCLQTFAMQDKKNAHEQKCDRPAYKCNVCNKSFGSNKAKLERHMRIHTGEKPFECNQCPKKFTRKSSLLDHMKIFHSQSLPWKCSNCRQGLSKESQRNNHQRSCTRRVYECFDCKKFIGSKITNLETHMLTHSGKKRCRCKICQKRFTQNGSLKRHLNTIHRTK